MDSTTIDDEIGYTSADPYPHYAELREAAAVHHLSEEDVLLTRYDDVLACVRDHELFSSQDARGGGSAAASIISQDPPDHTRMRHLVTGPFRPKAIAALEPDVREVTERLVDELIEANEQGEADFVAQFAAALPVIVIAKMMGIPVERHAEFRHWSDVSVANLAGLQPDDEEAAQATAEMADFFTGMIQDRRENPGDDLISAVLGGEEPLSDYEVLVFCFTLLVAGNETTTNLIGNALVALLANPGEMERLWADPSLVPSAMEEALRFDPPAQAVARKTTAPTAIDGHEIGAGATVHVLLASANRDPRRYDEPDRFDVTRNPPDHMAFGNGIHLCLGARLARLESRVAYETLIRRIRDVRPNGPVVRQLAKLRGVRSMPITFEPV